MIGQIKRFFQTAVAASLLAGVPGSIAASVTVDVTLDVNDIVPGLNGFTGGVQGVPPFSPGFSVTLEEGDDFDFTIDFVGNQTLTITDLTSIWAFSYADIDTEVAGTGTLTFLDTTGNALFSSLQKTSTEGSFHFGQFFINPDDFLGLANPITFGGLRYSGRIDDYIDPLVTVRTYAEPAFYFTVNTTGVPDLSGTVSLLALSLAPLLAFARRRK